MASASVEVMLRECYRQKGCLPVAIERMLVPDELIVTISGDSNEPRSAAIIDPSGEMVGFEKPPEVVSTVLLLTETEVDPEPSLLIPQS